jgi:hypothetical protein
MCRLGKDGTVWEIRGPTTTLVKIVKKVRSSSVDGSVVIDILIREKATSHGL